MKNCLIIKDLKMMHIYLLKFNTTNNIVESLNSIFNFYLSKRSTNNRDFINSISKILINSKLLEKTLLDMIL